MSVDDLYLIDKSTWVVAERNADAADTLRKISQLGRVAWCEPIALELLYSARNLRAYREIEQWLDGLTHLPVTEAVARRSVEIMGRLAERGQHRTTPMDLIIAATALEYRAILVHYDSDYERIAEVTGLTTVWIVPRGSA